MTSNGVSNPGSTVFVLYKVVNSESDENDPLFNCFSMPRGSKGPTLGTVKRHCAALHGLNHLGPEGYHWRVCVEDKPVPGESSTEKTFSWWDIQDENAHLPVKQATQSQLHRFFAPPKEDASLLPTTAKGAFKSLGKAVSSAVAGGMEVHDSGPAVTVIAFKLLDLVKMHDDFSHKNHGRGGHIPQPTGAAGSGAPARTRSARGRVKQPQDPVRSAPPPQRQQHQQQQRPQQQPPQRAPASGPRPTAPRPAAPKPAEASLMDFGPTAASNGHATLHSMSSFGSNQSNPNETRAEKLKREYEAKKQTANRVWDDVDQRWVEVDPKSFGNNQSTVSAPPGADAVNPNKKKEVGISLDPSSAVGKSASVQAAVNKRVNDMKESQAKALQEVREREEKKKAAEAEEDLVRKKLEPMIKAWSEEHGKKKQLRALLASLHTILWQGAEWKQITIGDLLDDGKLKRAFHKASRVVHPDKTHHLDAEKRFLAKRIFDALSQAKKEFDAGK